MFRMPCLPSSCGGDSVPSPGAWGLSALCHSLPPFPPSVPRTSCFWSSCLRPISVLSATFLSWPWDTHSPFFFQYCEVALSFSFQSCLSNSLVPAHQVFHFRNYILISQAVFWQAKCDS